MGEGKKPISAEILISAAEQTQQDKSSTRCPGPCVWSLRAWCWPVCWPSRNLQAWPSAGHLLCQLARQQEGHLTMGSLLMVPWGWMLLWDTGWQWGVMGCSRGHLPISPQKATAPLMPLTPGASAACPGKPPCLQVPEKPPSLQVRISVGSPSSHSAVFCHPPSQSVMLCLSLVLFCSSFCSLPTVCSLSNSWHWFVSLPALRLIWAFQHFLFLLSLYSALSPSPFLLMSASSTDQAMEGNLLRNPFQMVFSFLERILPSK